MATIEKINPLLYITDRDPIPEDVLDSSAWFKTETCELNFGEYVGRPDENIAMHKSMLAYFFANGWYVDAVLGGGSGGKWMSVANASNNTSATNTSQSTNTTDATNRTDGNATSRSTSKSTGKTNAKSSSSAYASNMTGYATNASSSGESSGDSSGTADTTGTSTNRGTASSKGTASANGTSQSQGTSTATTEQDGGPYWYAYNRIRLKRRKMQTELVLKDMISQFTRAYNEGRQINDERYDELVSLYALMLSRTEDEANAFAGLNVDDFKPLAKLVTDEIKKAIEEYKNAVGELPEDWMQSRIDEINRKFDALLAGAKSKMVSAGTYNSTVWPTTASGIERDRQIALNDLKDEMVTTKVDVYGKIASMTADVGKNLLDCEIKILEMQNKMMLGPTEMRNQVFKWMLDFMERREDDYPGLESIAQIAERLGYSDGATGGNAA